MSIIAVVGAGYVGLGTAALFAYLGHTVRVLDVDAFKIAQLEVGDLPLYEPGLGELLAQVGGRLRWTTSYAEATAGVNLIFVCVGTPPLQGGQPDLAPLEQAMHSLMLHLEGKPTTVVLKSTVPIGTGARLGQCLEDPASRQRSSAHTVVSNPEFLREGSALSDCFYPDRIVLGGHSAALEPVQALYQPLISQSFVPPPHLPRPPHYLPPTVVRTTHSGAEMIKYAANAFLALKISFANELAGLSERVGTDIEQVTRGVGLDRRIGTQHLSAGAGWGGSCLGKDTQALLHTGSDHGYEMPILRAAIQINERQRRLVLEKLRKHLPQLEGKRVAVLGLAFKPNTDDVRDAPAHDFILWLEQLGATVVAYDPVALPRARMEWNDLRYLEAPSAQIALEGADAAIIATEWDEFRTLDWKHALRRMRTRVLIDARNVIPIPLETPATLEQMGRPAVLESAFMENSS